MIKKKYVICLLIVLILACFNIVSIVHANTLFGDGFDPNNVASMPKDPIVENINGISAKIWNTSIIVIQIVCMLSIILIGVKYMFSNADKKADIKQTLIKLTIGIVLVYCSSFVATVIRNIFVNIVSH